MPKFGTLHVEQRLTNYSQRMNNPAFVNEALFPEMMVKFEADKYLVYDNSMFNLYDTTRADGAESTQVQWDISDAKYFAEEHSAKDIVTDRQRANADKPLTIDIDTLEVVQAAVMLRKEYDAAQIATNPSNYLAANTSALTGTAQWDQSGSTPLKDFQTMQKAVRNSSLQVPNTIILPYDVAIALAYNQQMLDLVRYTKDNLPQNMQGNLLDGLLPDSLFGMKVVIAASAYNTANPGQTSDLADIWGKNVIVAYVERSPKLKSISYGKTFRTEKYVRKWREESRHGDWVEYNDIYDLAQTSNACGYLLQTVIA